MSDYVIRGLNETCKQLRAQLTTVTADLAQCQRDLAACAESRATVTAELAEWRRVAAEHCDSLDTINEACEVAESSLIAERAAHAETRKALEASGQALASECENAFRLGRALESTRAELAKSEARVKELEREVATWSRIYG